MTALFILLSLFGIHVHDGDTFTILATHQRVRLWGIDAPELDQTCGSLACGHMSRDALTALITSEVKCSERGRSYDRSVGVCHVGTVDLSEAMVREGWALDWPKYSHGAYAQAEHEARAAHRGIWATNFTRPWDYRRDNHLNNHRNK